MRKNILKSDNVERELLDMLGEVTSMILDTHASADVKQDEWNLDGLNNALQQQFGVRIDFSTFPNLNSESLTDAVSKIVKDMFDRQKASLGQFYHQIQKMILLQAIDQRWKEHLQRIDRVKEGINLRGYAQKDPVIEYKKEAFKAFEELNQAIKTDAIEKFLKVQIVAPESAQQDLSGMLQNPDFSEMNFAGGDEAATGGAIRADGARGGARGEEAPPSNGRQRMRMTAGPGPEDEEPKMNRAQRRQMEKRKR